MRLSLNGKLLVNDQICVVALWLDVDLRPVSQDKSSMAIHFLILAMVEGPFCPRESLE